MRTDAVALAGCFKEVIESVERFVKPSITCVVGSDGDAFLFCKLHIVAPLWLHVVEKFFFCLVKRKEYGVWWLYGYWALNKRSICLLYKRRNTCIKSIA